jgi:hypothetical protein
MYCHCLYMYYYSMVVAIETVAKIQKLLLKSKAGNYSTGEWMQNPEKGCDSAEQEDIVDKMVNKNKTENSSSVLFYYYYRHVSLRCVRVIVGRYSGALLRGDIAELTIVVGNSKKIDNFFYKHRPRYK